MLDEDGQPMAITLFTVKDAITPTANPGNLPIEQPVKFDFVVALKTAKADRVPPSAPSLQSRSNSATR
jgi:hypothetical protein